jgi:hypothetical protein
MAIYKNTTGQKLAVYAYTVADGAAKTGDAAQITSYLSKDWGGPAAVTDTNPTELNSTNMPGWYVFDLEQAETNAEVIVFAPKSSTSGVVLDQVQVFTQDATISSRASQTSVDDIPTVSEFEARTLAAADYTIVSDLGTVQTGDAFARLGAPAGASVSADVAAVKSDTAAILVDTGTTLDTLIKDVPTVAEFEARTLAAASYATATALADVPTATENADALLKRDWAEVSSEAARSVLNALRFLRNKRAIATGTLTVTKEDDSTPAWTADVVGDAEASPVTSIDPT